ncbi:MAG: hypothetical protein ABR558_07620 [Thioalkalivibrio sp.]
MSRLLVLVSLLFTLVACGGSDTVQGVAGTVSLDPELAEQVSPEETVFLFARLPEGPPMPLAIQRLQVKDLPYRFQLDDSHAMTERVLSSVPQVVVVARVSRSGQAMPRAGDLEGQSGVVSVGTDGLEIMIGRVLQ